eukprot:gene13090-biopygen7357
MIRIAEQAVDCGSRPWGGRCGLLLHFPGYPGLVVGQIPGRGPRTPIAKACSWTRRRVEATSGTFTQRACPPCCGQVTEHRGKSVGVSFRGNLLLNPFSHAGHVFDEIPWFAGVCGVTFQRMYCKRQVRDPRMPSPAPGLRPAERGAGQPRGG